MEYAMLFFGILAIFYSVIVTLSNKRLTTEIFENKLEHAKLKDYTRDMQEVLTTVQEELGKERERNREILSLKKSSETRLGGLAENFIPFLENCPYNPRDMSHQGMPIDFLVYNFDQGEITFLEIKSGSSKASKRQKTIKNIIKSGRVYYAEMRLDSKGIKHKRYENIEKALPMPKTEEVEE